MGRQLGKQATRNGYRGVGELQSVINKEGSGHTEMEKSLIPHFLHAMQRAQTCGQDILPLCCLSGRSVWDRMGITQEEFGCSMAHWVN